MLTLKEMCQIEAEAINAYKTGKTLMDNPYFSEHDNRRHEYWNNVYMDYADSELNSFEDYGN
jgi:hypothetical protein